MYAGRVYDGPSEGEYRTAGRPFIEFAHVGPGPEPFQWGARPGAIVNVTVTTYAYRWSHALRAWVFIW